MKNINNFTQWEKGSVDAMCTRAITHQKHQSERSMRSAVDYFNTLRVFTYFNTLRVFTNEPIREQEIELECMNIN